MPMCACGCGQNTAGGDFLPGHDQKLRSMLEQTVGGLLNLKQLVHAAEQYAQGQMTLEYLGQQIVQLLDQE